MVAAAGGAGGDGIQSGFAGASGSGGGGGGSYGGGGGGGAPGLVNTVGDNSGDGGGGGGGAFGGGGGGTGDQGGGGGRYGQGGAAGSGGTPGLLLVGGNGAANFFPQGTNGGNFSQGGGGADNAQSGANVISGGMIGPGGSISLTAATGNIGSKTVALDTLSPSVTVTNTSGSTYINNIAGIQNLIVQAGNKANVQIAAGGNIGNATIAAGTINLSTLPGSNGGITCGAITGATVTVEADGTGNILSGSSALITATSELTLICGTGGIGTSVFPLLTATKTLAVTATVQSSALTAPVNIGNSGDLTLLASSTNGFSSPFQLTTTGSLTVQGAVNSSGSNGLIFLTAQNNIVLKADTIASFVSLTAGNNISDSGVTETGVSGALNLSFGGSLGSSGSPFKANVGAIILSGAGGASRSAYILSSNSSPEELLNTTTGGTLVYTTISSALNLNSGPFTNQTVTDTAAGGSITVNSLIGNMTAPGTINLATKGGAMTTGAGDDIEANLVNLVTAGGAIGSAAARFSVDSTGITSVVLQAGSAPVFINSNTLMVLSGAAGTINVTDSQPIDSTGQLTATSINLTSTTSSVILMGTTTTNSLVVMAAGGCQSGIIKTTGANPTISLTSGAGGGIELSGQVGSGTGNITLTGGAIAGSGLLDGTNVSMSGTSIGFDSSLPIQISATGTVTASGSVSTYLHSTGNINIGAGSMAGGSAGDTFALVSKGQIAVLGALGADTIDLTGSSITLTANAFVSANNATMIASKGAFIVNAGGASIATNTTVQAAAVQVDGQLYTSLAHLAQMGTLSITNPTGSLTISGQGEISNAGTVTLSALTNLDISSTLCESLNVASPAATITLTAGKV